jgi:predicted ATPase
MAVNPDFPLYRIVLTGGPCGGKTTALARLSSYLRERGFEVFTVPEAFTILCSNGLTMDYFASREGMDLIIQGTVLDLQEALEDGMEQILRARGKPAVILCDRGFMDGAAYMGMERFQSFLQGRNKDIADAREGRYNAVIHMVTAADGAPSFYSLENNVARSETPQEAIALDKKTQEAWMGHPRLLVLDNTTDFEGKMQRLIEAVAKLVGLPTNLSRAATKFKLLAIPDLSKFTVDYQIFEVEKIYLLAPATEQFNEPSSGSSHQYSFIRKRTIIGKDGNKVGGSVYGITLVKKTIDGQIMEMKRIITSREYASSMKQRDVTRHIIQQKRISFLYKHQSFSIHVSTEMSLSMLNPDVILLFMKFFVNLFSIQLIVFVFVDRFMKLP